MHSFIELGILLTNCPPDVECYCSGEKHLSIQYVVHTERQSPQKYIGHSFGPFELKIRA